MASAGYRGRRQHDELAGHHRQMRLHCAGNRIDARSLGDKGHLGRSISGERDGEVGEDERVHVILAVDQAKWIVFPSTAVPVLGENT
jgi:hypothetical protein